MSTKALRKALTLAQFTTWAKTKPLDETFDYVSPSERRIASAGPPLAAKAKPLTLSDM